MSPRRGYHVRVDGYGGYGSEVFENDPNDNKFPISIAEDGNLYQMLDGSITISFSGSSDVEFITYEIYIDEDETSDTDECDFDPYDTISDQSLTTDSINFKLSKVTQTSGESIGSGSDTYSGTLSNPPLQPGSLVVTDGTLTLFDDAAGSFYGDTGAGTNSINYTTGAYSLSFSGSTGTTTATYNTPLTEILDIAMGKGYLESTPYSIDQLLAALNGVSGVTATANGDTTTPAAFLQVTEAINIANGDSDTLSFEYPSQVNKTVTSTFSGLIANQSDDDWKMATMALYDEIVFIGSRYDEVRKYDGQTVYRAGMPKGADVDLTNNGAGDVDTGVHVYQITYEQIDNRGNIVEGVISDAESITLTSDSQIDVTVSNSRS
jgi:hypothetical protein